MRSLPVRRAAAATATLLALGGLSACGGSDDSTATDPAESASSESTAAEPSETPGSTIDTTEFVDQLMAAAADATTAHLSMTMDGGPAAMTMEGDVDYSSDPPEMSMTMSSPSAGGEIAIRLVDGVMYMQMEQLTRGKWIKMDMTGKDSPLGQGLMDQMNPGASLDQMQDSIQDVTFVGDEEVDGESMQHYSMKVRSKAFLALQDELQTSGGSAIPSVITYDVWVDDQGLMRQTKLAMGSAGSMTVQMSKWGEPVDITAPPESDILTMPQGWMQGPSGA